MSGVAVSRAGSTLLVICVRSQAIHEFRVSDGSRLRVIGCAGDGRLQFDGPRQLWVASDNYVFVAEYGNSRVQVLTLRLDFHAFVGVGVLDHPDGVCANDAVIVVSEAGVHRISVFNRGDGALLRRFGSEGRGDGQLNWPRGLCFMSGDRHIAVAESGGGADGNNRVSVFSMDGEFIRHVGVGKLSRPESVACSAFDEIVVADYGNGIVVFSGSGELVTTMGGRAFTGVAMHGGTIFAHAQDYPNAKCTVFE